MPSSKVLAAIAAIALAAAVRGQDQPNIVFIMADDLGWGDLGCYGNAVIETPRIDQLAQQGTLFTQFYVASPVCSPTRAAIVTGRFPSELSIHSAMNNQTQWNLSHGMPDWLDPFIPTVMGELQDLGYATALYGKWNLGSTLDAPLPTAYGLDESRTVSSNTNGNVYYHWQYEYFRSISTDLFVDDAIAFIEANYQDGPFFVSIMTILPHARLDPAPEHLARYAHLQQPVPYVAPRQIYYASVSPIDDAVGTLLDRLDVLGLADNTLVVFTSDNGPAPIQAGPTSYSGVGSPGPFRGKKWSLYEGGIRMPLIVRWPGHVPAGVVDNTSVITAVDFLPTFVNLAQGAAPPAQQAVNNVFGQPPGMGTGPPIGQVDDGGVVSANDGEDVTGILLGQPRAREKAIFWEWRFSQSNLRPVDRSPMLAVRVDNWKLLLNPDGSRVELYDVVADPGESQNLADVNPDVTADLSAQALAWAASLPAGPVSPAAGDNAYPWP